MVSISPWELKNLFKMLGEGSNFIRHLKLRLDTLTNHFCSKQFVLRHICVSLDKCHVTDCNMCKAFKGGPYSYFQVLSLILCILHSGNHLASSNALRILGLHQMLVLWNSSVVGFDSLSVCCFSGFGLSGTYKELRLLFFPHPQMLSCSGKYFLTIWSFI